MKKKIKYLPLLVIVLGIVGFVGLNFWRERNVEKISQDNIPTLLELTEGGAAVSLEGSFSGSGPYRAGGGASVQTLNNQSYLVFDEAFNTSSGPDLVIYLSENNVQAGEDLGEFVSLGRIADTSGEQVYALPDNIDDFSSVVIWCRAFSAQFGAADIE